MAAIKKSEENDVKTVKKPLRKKKKHPVKTFFSLVAIVSACFLTYSAGQELLTTLQLNKDIADAQTMINDLQQQKEDYEVEKTNLNNPEYVKSYARGKYMVSKDGEQIIKYPQKSDE